MPKHDFTPAKTPDELDGFLDYLEDKITHCHDKDERERLWRIRRRVTIESIASLYIANAWQKVRLERVNND